mgnify:FL=1
MKKIYQTKDSNGQEKTWINIKPEFNNGVYYDFKYNNEYHTYYPYFIFPILLNKCQIAEIIINTNGEWRAEKEREEGWYAAKRKDSISNPYDYPQFFQYENGKFMIDRRNVLNIDEFETSYNRIPDECFLK